MAVRVHASGAIINTQSNGNRTMGNSACRGYMKYRHLRCVRDVAKKRTLENLAGRKGIEMDVMVYVNNAIKYHAKRIIP